MSQAAQNLVAAIRDVLRERGYELDCTRLESVSIPLDKGGMLYIPLVLH